mgnify:FL=1
MDGMPRSGQTGPMLIRTETELMCTADAAWEAVHSPAVASELYAPVLRMRAEGGFPVRFSTGDRRTVRLLAFDRVTLGTQLIHIEDHLPGQSAPGARVMRDRGRPLTGPLARLARCQHQMTILPSPTHADRAIWRDELSIAGASALWFGPVLTVMWRVRQWKIRRLARAW